MSNVTASPITPRNEVRGPSDHLAGRTATTRSALDDSSLAEAVREGATRAAIAAGLGGLAVIHAVDAVGKWSETRYVFWMYIAAIVSAIAVAGWTLFTRSRTALIAAAGLSASVLLGYVVNRTVGLPNATDDIGNWTEPLGLASMVVESVTIAIAAGAYAAVSGPRARS